jgi:glycerophosphoryl diester phosphodiesterase
MVAIVGHRGARDLWPENSLDGFRRTRALSIEAVEFDVHPTRDGELVVIHDPLLDRTVESHGPVADYSAAELSRLRLRDGNGEGVPTLDAVLDVFEGSGIELHLEIKTDALGNAYKGLEQRLLEALARRRNLGPTIVTCFVPEVIEKVRALAPHQTVLASLDRRSAEMMGGLTPALDRFARIEGCLVAVEKGLLSVAFDLCRDRIGSERLGVWVPNEPRDIARWLQAPIRTLTTDRPDLALAERRKL